jgi:hypothetical protein
MLVKTSEGYVSIQNMEDVEELKAVAESLKIKDYKNIDNPQELLKKIKRQ